jgi:hypothetical protein
MDGTRWRKSSRSGSTSDCVEVDRSTRRAAVRDSKHPGPTLSFAPERFDAFLATARAARRDS